MKMKIGVVFLFIFLLCGCAAPHEFAGPELSAPHPVPDVELMSVSGPVRLSDFQGKYLFVYFGYTFCPDVCPLTLSTLQSVRKRMPEEASQIQVVMISVDPERDTPEVLAKYMSYFDDTFVGITGSPEEIASIGEPFGLFYEKGEGSAATGYLISHSARAYLIDPEGNARVAYPHGATDDQIIADLKYLFETES
ncbi:MAG: SCO family protein [Caldilineaceae bacterium]|nr:SCO family protein [Caldilineaceae bacterium]